MYNLSHPLMDSPSDLSRNSYCIEPHYFKKPTSETLAEFLSPEDRRGSKVKNDYWISLSAANGYLSDSETRKTICESFKLSLLPRILGDTLSLWDS